MLTKEDAEEIARKLGASIKKKNRRHDLATIYYSGKLVAFFGIRRGSRKDAGHDHIPRSIYVSPHFCKELSRCTKYLADWLEELAKQNLLH